jgi:3-oxoacyl-[acyl-carrier protein] reductase
MADTRTALVIGGSRGIGKAIALRLASSGFDIWLTYKGNHEAAGRTRAEIEAMSGIPCCPRTWTGSSM